MSESTTTITPYLSAAEALITAAVVLRGAACDRAGGGRCSSPTKDCRHCHAREKVSEVAVRCIRLFKEAADIPADLSGFDALRMAAGVLALAAPDSPGARYALSLRRVIENDLAKVTA